MYIRDLNQYGKSFGNTICFIPFLIKLKYISQLYKYTSKTKQRKQNGYV